MVWGCRPLPQSPVLSPQEGRAAHGPRGHPAVHKPLETLLVFLASVLVEGFVFGIVHDSFFVSWVGIMFGRSALQNSNPMNFTFACPLSFCCWVFRRRRLSLLVLLFSLLGAGPGSLFFPSSTAGRTPTTGQAWPRHCSSVSFTVSFTVSVQAGCRFFLLFFFFSLSLYISQLFVFFFFFILFFKIFIPFFAPLSCMHFDRRVSRRIRMRKLKILDFFGNSVDVWKSPLPNLPSCKKIGVEGVS